MLYPGWPNQDVWALWVDTASWLANASSLGYRGCRWYEDWTYEWVRLALQKSTQALCKSPNTSINLSDFPVGTGVGGKEHPQGWAQRKLDCDVGDVG